MKKNMGNQDKIIRSIIAIIFAVLYFTGVVGGVLGIILMVVSIIFLATSFLSFCPLYTIFGIKTCKVKN